MKTIGGYLITEFKKLDKEVERGLLEPHIYGGYHNNLYVTWDKFGRVSNQARWHDCNIDISTLKNSEKENRNIPDKDGGF